MAGTCRGMNGRRRLCLAAVWWGLSLLCVSAPAVALTRNGFLSADTVRPLAAVLADTAALVPPDTTLAPSGILTAPDTIVPLSDMLAITDTTAVPSDSVDTAATSADSTASTPKQLTNSSAVTEVVRYSAKDSIYMDMATGLAHLYADAKLDYQGAKMEAAYMELDLRKSEVFAQPVADSTGELIGLPHFDNGKDAFDAKEIRYNFKTERGLIKEVVTVQEEIFVHGQVVKRYENEEIHIRKAQFTSCELDHPHFDIRAYKAKVIPNDKIVIGVGMMFVEDVPTPLVLPFALLPNSKTRRSGVLIPTFGQSARDGYFFRGLGYYQRFGDYADLKVVTDLYTGGNWEIRGDLRYAWRYHFSGSLGVGYSQIYDGTRGDPGRTKQTGVSVRWTHSQDGKAHPNSSFSANVNFQNTAYARNSPDLIAYITNTTTSNITYSYSYANKFHLALNAGNSYNTNTNTLSLNLPSVNFSISTLYPFRRKKQVGKRKWYETIGFNYRLEARNEINTPDTLFFRPEMFDYMRNGMRQSVGLSSTVKILKHINWTNSVSYNEYWYLKNFRQSYVEDSTGWHLQTEERKGFKTTRDFQYNTSFNFKLYGIFRFKRGALKAFRHVMTPSVGFTYHPDFSKPFWNAYDTYIDNYGQTHLYSKFANTLYGGPSAGMVGSVNFSINNTFDMKVRNRKDTVTGEKKVNLIDQLSVSTSYNMAADSLRWSPVSLSARTVLFKRLNVGVNTQFDFYKIDSMGRRYDEFFWENNKIKGLRFTRTNVNISLSWSFNPKSKGSSAREPNTMPSLNETMVDPQITSYANPLYTNSDLFTAPVDFSVPWNLSLTYYGSYTMTPYLPRDTRDAKHPEAVFRHQFMQTIGLAGDFSLTPKWKITFSTGFDITNRKMTLTSINFARDLHCWEMGFYWVPWGGHSEWHFHIRIRSSVFQDIKYEKRKDYRDSEINMFQ